MNLSEHSFEQLSDIQYRVFTTKLGGKISPSALVLEFVGRYGHGSGGNDDATFMRAITLSAISAWDAGAVLFDLRELDYEWGDEIWSVFGSQSIPPAMLEEPQALIVSDRCREGFSTCSDMVPEMFDDLDSAIAYVRQERLIRRGQSRAKRLGSKQSIPTKSLFDRLCSMFNRR